MFVALPTFSFPHMKKIFALFLLVLMGAGCGKTSSKAEPTTASTPTNVLRVAVPELCFSYIPDQRSNNVAPPKIVGTRLYFGGVDPIHGQFIERIPRRTGQTFTDAVSGFISTHGAQMSRCAIEPLPSIETNIGWRSPNTFIANVVTKPKYVPSQKQIYDFVRSQDKERAKKTNSQIAKGCNESPECAYAANALIDRYTRSHCGPYAARSSLFVTDRENANAPIIYVTTDGDNAPYFDGGPIMFLP